MMEIKDESEDELQDHVNVPLDYREWMEANPLPVEKVVSLRLLVERFGDRWDGILMMVAFCFAILNAVIFVLVLDSISSLFQSIARSSPLEFDQIYSLLVLCFAGFFSAFFTIFAYGSAALRILLKTFLAYHRALLRQTLRFRRKDLNIHAVIYSCIGWAPMLYQFTIMILVFSLFCIIIRASVFFVTLVLFIPLAAMLHFAWKIINANQGLFSNIFGKYFHMKTKIILPKNYHDYHDWRRAYLRMPFGSLHLFPWTRLLRIVGSLAFLQMVWIFMVVAAAASAESVNSQDVSVIIVSLSAMNLIGSAFFLSKKIYVGKCVLYEILKVIDSIPDTESYFSMESDLSANEEFSLSFDNIYTEDKVLDGISLQIHEGKNSTIAFIGDPLILNKCINLMLCLEEYKGCIAVDSIDVCRWEPLALRKRISVLGSLHSIRNNIILGLSIYDNIVLGIENVPTKRVLRVAKSLNIHDKVESTFNKSYATILNVENLSLFEDFEIAKLVLCRALILNASPKLLVLHHILDYFANLPSDEIQNLVNVLHRHCKLLLITCDPTNSKLLNVCASIYLLSANRCVIHQPPSNSIEELSMEIQNLRQNFDAHLSKRVSFDSPLEKNIPIFHPLKICLSGCFRVLEYASEMALMTDNHTIPQFERFSIEIGDEFSVDIVPLLFSLDMKRTVHSELISSFSLDRDSGTLGVFWQNLKLLKTEMLLLKKWSHSRKLKTLRWSLLILYLFSFFYGCLIPLFGRQFGKAMFSILRAQVGDNSSYSSLSIFGIGMAICFLLVVVCRSFVEDYYQHFLIRKCVETESSLSYAYSLVFYFGNHLSTVFITLGIAAAALVILLLSAWQLFVVSAGIVLLGIITFDTTMYIRSSNLGSAANHMLNFVNVLLDLPTKTTVRRLAIEDAMIRFHLQRFKTLIGIMSKKLSLFSLSFAFTLFLEYYSWLVISAVGMQLLFIQGVAPLELIRIAFCILFIWHGFYVHALYLSRFKLSGEEKKRLLQWFLRIQTRELRDQSIAVDSDTGLDDLDLDVAVPKVEIPIESVGYENVGLLNFDDDKTRFISIELNLNANRGSSYIPIIHLEDELQIIEQLNLSLQHYLEVISKYPIEDNLASERVVRTMGSFGFIEEFPSGIRGGILAERIQSDLSATVRFLLSSCMVRNLPACGINFNGISLCDLGESYRSMIQKVMSDREYVGCGGPRTLLLLVSDTASLETLQLHRIGVGFKNDLVYLNRTAEILQDPESWLNLLVRFSRKFHQNCH